MSHLAAAAANSAGLDLPRAFHTLRHTAASWMVQAGVPLYEVQTILGHSSPLLTQRYSHLAPDFCKRGAAAIDAVLAAAGTAPKS